MFLQSLHRTNLYPQDVKELKFSLNECKLKEKYTEQDVAKFKGIMPHVRSNVINLINRYSDGVFISILDKNSIREPTWTSERLCNYIFAHTLQHNILNSINISKNPQLLFDSGRLSIPKEIDFIRYLYDKDSFLRSRNVIRYDGRFDNISPVSSHLEPCIWASDILAGGALRDLNEGNMNHYNMIDPDKLIGNGYRIFL